MASVIDFFRRKGAVTTLMAINAAVFVIVGLSISGFKAGLCPSLEPWLVLPGFPAAIITRPWTLFTYMFTHTHPLHLLFNLIWLGWFGSLLLQVKSGRYLVWLHIAGGICGGLFYVFLCPLLDFPHSYLLGASASVLAIMCAAAVRMPSMPVHLFFIGDVKLKWVALFMIVLAFLGLGGGNAGGELAHLGGAACGLIAGFNPVGRHMPAPGVKKKNPHQIKPKRISHVISVMEQHRLDVTRLDELLDKIRISGFDSLTEAERKELRELSKRLQK